MRISRSGVPTSSRARNCSRRAGAWSSRRRRAVRVAVGRVAQQPGHSGSPPRRLAR
ncbi:hypothetical protein [Actinomadura yumaensis]|uniref:hypothetical protein n=1 Tax=Actinomadura yumaensis TaxID=111807 RepID=UPI00366DEE93